MVSIVPMILTLLDNPGDCPIGMNISVAFCPWADSIPPQTITPRAAPPMIRLSFPTAPPFSSHVTRRRLRGLDKESSSPLLLLNGLASQFSSGKNTPVRLLRQPLRLLQTGHGFGMQTPAFEDSDAIARLTDGAIQELLRLGSPLLETRLQLCNGFPDVLQGIDHPQEGGNGHDLGSVQLDSHFIRISGG